MGTLQFKREIILAGQLADLPVVIDFVADACTQARIDQSAQLDLQLAVEEACTNVIEHAYEGAGGPIHVSFEARDHHVVITLRDRGKPFDPEAVASPNFDLPLEERPLGGLGLHLMIQLMDEVSFSLSEDGENVLVMVKRGVLPSLGGVENG